MRVVFRILVALPTEQAVRECSFDDLRPMLARPEARVWVDLTAPIGEVETAIVRDVFKFHPIAIEDCFASRAHPKIDDYEGYLYLITHGLSAGATAESAEPVELDAFLGPNFLVTYHARPFAQHRRGDGTGDEDRDPAASGGDAGAVRHPRSSGGRAGVGARQHRGAHRDPGGRGVRAAEERPHRHAAVGQAQHPRAAPLDRQAARGAAAAGTQGVRPDLGRGRAAVSRRA